jgi:hypothetical protein
MQPNWIIKTPPVAYPITMDQAKKHCKVFNTDEDTIIQIYLGAACAIVERDLGRCLMPTTFQMFYDDFLDIPERSLYNYILGTIPPNRRAWNDDRMHLPLPPVQSISSIKYTDATGTVQTMASGDYVLDNVKEPCFVYPAFGKSWPASRGDHNNVIIEYVAGYADASKVPLNYKSAILLLVGHLYENRQEVVAGQILNTLPMGYESLLTDSCKNPF